jgi:hypothetical protein
VGALSEISRVLPDPEGGGAKLGKPAPKPRLEEKGIREEEVVKK